MKKHFLFLILILTVASVFPVDITDFEEIFGSNIGDIESVKGYPVKPKAEWDWAEAFYLLLYKYDKYHIHFPYDHEIGNYIIDETLVITEPNVMITGEPKTLLIGRKSANQNITLFLVQNQKVRFRDLRLQGHIALFIGNHYLSDADMAHSAYSIYVEEGRDLTPSDHPYDYRVLRDAEMTLVDGCEIQADYVGILLRSGNCSRFTNLFITSCNYGMLFDPISGIEDNTNGCYVSGSRFMNNRIYGLWLKRNANAAPKHNAINASFEENGIHNLPGEGPFVTAFRDEGRYNVCTIYTERNYDPAYEGPPENRVNYNGNFILSEDSLYFLMNVDNQALGIHRPNVFSFTGGTLYTYIQDLHTPGF